MLLYSVADQIVFSILKKIDVGFLEISTFSGEVLKFGNPNDKLKVNLQIKTPALNYNFIKGGSIGFAECYMRNEFETNNLSDLIELTARNINIVHKFAGVLDLKFFNFIKNKFIKNTKSRSKENIAKHYDLGNDFFSLWLDKTLTYSSAIFDDQNKDLSDAQNNKYQKLINLLKQGVGALPCVGDGRQSGTPGSPSILNASPEAVTGGNLAILKTNDIVRIDLNERSVNIKISKTEIAKRKRQLKKSGGHPIPDSQTPWQEIQREIVDELSEGMVLKPATKYQKIDRKKGIPRDNH